VPPRNRITRVNDILEALERIERYSEQLRLEGLQNDDRTRDAIVWNFAVIGEAARLIPLEVEERYPGIPWAKMRGMRNVLMHEYFGIDDQIILETVTSDLPPLKKRLREVVENQ
jgi:uncharacterized protein with HEPN domain